MMTLPKGFLDELVSEIENNPEQDITKLKIRLCKKYGITSTPTNIHLLGQLKECPDKIKKIFITKPSRSLSGVNVIAIMTKPIQCPHGKCIYCPGGLKSIFGDVPQSYTGKEPATMRAIRAGYDSYKQVFNRLEQYVVSGHTPEKIELIIMGGTFLSYPEKYQNFFVKNAFMAMNDFSDKFFSEKSLNMGRIKKFFELPANVKDNNRIRRIFARIERLKGRKKSTLIAEQRRNEKSNIRCVGMTIETRPDYGMLSHGNRMLSLGATRVELGVQSVYNRVLKFVHREHTIEDVKKSTRILKDLGFKINYHYMIGLPLMNAKSEILGLKKLFSDKDLRPDMLKIYPCMLMRGTKLYELYLKGDYEPINTKAAVKIISSFKPFVPEYCRIMRIQRDIPSKYALNELSNNLRQLVAADMRKSGKECKCIRCREIKNLQFNLDDAETKIMRYKASKGTEFFISVECNNKIIGFCRLRFPSQSLRKEITKDSAIVRELHVYGKAEKIGKKGVSQHRGIGKHLMQTAEQICIKHKKRKILVISGIGVREYYKKLGYKLEGPYMVKYLK